jgi:nicotinamidase/pyrazinamidase
LRANGAGLATDYCVKFTVLDALNLGYTVNVITDGCRGVNIQPQDSNLAFMEMAAAGATLYTLTTGWKPTRKCRQASCRRVISGQS